MSSKKVGVAHLEPVWYVNRTLLFSALTDDERHELAEKGKLIPVAKGESIYSEGDPGRQVYLIKEGATFKAPAETRPSLVFLAGSIAVPGSN